MNRKMIAAELVKLAKSLIAEDAPGLVGEMIGDIDRNVNGASELKKELKVLEGFLYDHGFHRVHLDFNKHNFDNESRKPNDYVNALNNLVDAIKEEQRDNETFEEKNIRLVEKLVMKAKSLAHNYEANLEEEQGEDDRDDVDIIYDLASEFDGDVRTDYSGRGMMGDICYGIVSDRVDAIDRKAKQTSLGEGKIDNMGRSGIIYWPHVKGK